MSYSVSLLFVHRPFETEGDAIKFGMDLVKQIATEGPLARKQVDCHMYTINNLMRMAGCKDLIFQDSGLKDNEGKVDVTKEILYSDVGRLALMVAAHTIFSQRMLYWPEHKILAFIGNCIPDELKEGMTEVYFQNSCDQDYAFEDWSDEIPIFREEKEFVRSLQTAEVYSMLDWDSDSEESYVRRTLLYQRIFDKLHLDSFLYHGQEEEGFRLLHVCGIINQEVEHNVKSIIRRFILNKN